MIGWEFSIHGIRDQDTFDRNNPIIDKAVVNMGACDHFGFVAVPGGSHIVGDAGVYISKMPDHSVVCRAARLHIEITQHQGGEVGDLLTVGINQLTTFDLSIVAKTKMRVHHYEGFATCFFSQNYIVAYPEAIVQFIPTAGLYFRRI